MTSSPSFTLLNMRSHGGYHACGFVPGNERKAHVLTNAFDGFVIRGADAAGLDSHQGFIRLGLWNGPVFQHEFINVV